MSADTPWDGLLQTTHILERVPILVYHQITADEAVPDAHGYAVPVSRFEDQMRWLYEQGYHCLSLPDLVNGSLSEPRPHRKMFVLTFDDGYEDFVTRAYPILCRYGFTATVFLITDHIGRDASLVDEPMLSWDQVRDLYRDGIFFGSHTCTHACLPDLSAKEAWRELVDSRKRIKAEIDPEMFLLAYPFGQSSQEIQRMAMQAYYGAAFGVLSRKIDRFNIWRWPCRTQDGLFSLAWKLSPFYRHLASLRRRIREDTLAGQLLVRIKRRWFRRQ